MCSYQTSCRRAGESYGQRGSTPAEQRIGGPQVPRTGAFEENPACRLKAVRKNCPLGLGLMTMSHKHLPNVVELDAIAWKIIEHLQQNARLPFAELGRKVGLSTPA